MEIKCSGGSGSLTVLVFWLVSMAFASPVSAAKFGATLEDAQWHLQASPLDCKLKQQVPQYGEVVFHRESGGTLHFYMDSERPSVFNGEAEIKVIAPPWRTGIRDKSIATVKLRKGKRPLILEGKWANWFLDELFEGMNPAIVLSGWHDSKKIVVDISPVNFQEAYNGYLSCVAGLFPSNYQQLRNSTLNYSSDKWRLKGKMLARLDLLVRYIELDPEIDHIYIDGHADSEGRRGHNWELSRLRGRAVLSYMELKGVDPSMMTMRYHGETRPMVKNSNRTNRGKNRRVYIQLIKSEEWNDKSKLRE